MGSPEPASGVEGTTDLTVGTKGLHGRIEETMGAESKMSPNVSAAAHLNGSKEFRIIVYFYQFFIKNREFCTELF